MVIRKAPSDGAEISLSIYNDIRFVLDISYKKIGEKEYKEEYYKILPKL